MLYAMTTAELLELPELWRAVLRLRHEVFVEELGWQALARPNQLETDQFDHEAAVHHLVFRDGRLAGYQRMLPTMQAFQLPELFPELCAGSIPSGPDIFELTRYAVARPFRDGRRGVATVGSELMAGFIEWGLLQGVDKIIVEAEPMWVTRTLQLQFLVRPLGLVRNYGRQQVVAMLLQFDAETLQAVRERRNHFEAVYAATPGQGLPMVKLAS